MTFTFVQDFGSTKTTTPRVSTIQFGDGYKQRIKNGINTLDESWSLRFSNRELAEMEAIEAFLRATDATESFNWTPPRGTDPIKVICTAWNRSFDHATRDTITATFERNYDP